MIFAVIKLFSLFFIFPLALRTAKVIYYAPVAPFGADAILDNRKLEIKENYNSYNEIGRSQDRLQSEVGTIEHSNNRTFEQFPKFLAKRIRAHDGCLGIRRL